MTILKLRTKFTKNKIIQNKQNKQNNYQSYNITKDNSIEFEKIYNNLEFSIIDLIQSGVKCYIDDNILLKVESKNVKINFTKEESVILVIYFKFADIEHELLDVLDSENYLSEFVDEKTAEKICLKKNKEIDEKIKILENNGFKIISQ